jgi:hypothetical protein
VLKGGVLLAAYGLRRPTADIDGAALQTFHVDITIGDPIWPEPAEISLPRLLGQESIQLRGYPMEMVLAPGTAQSSQPAARAVPETNLASVTTPQRRSTAS